jgi:4-hydroxy-tetrahydrodipicolinate synthase
MAKCLLSGVLPIVQTPFDDADRIDWPILQSEVDWGFDLGIQGLGTGMVSEVRTLADGERSELAKRLIEFANARGPVFMAVTADTSDRSLKYAKDAQRCGCQAVMAAPPTVEPLDAQGLYEFYSGLADAVDIPIIVQDASGYTGAPIPMEVYLRLLERYDSDKILFKPEASPNGPTLSALRDASRGTAKMYEGSGGIYLIDSFRRGVRGTMPGMDLVDGIVAIWEALQRGDEQSAYGVYLPLCAIVALQIQSGLDGFLAIEKYLLHKRGLFRNEHRRGPIRWHLDQETAAEVDRLFERLQSALSQLQPVPVGS